VDYLELAELLFPNIKKTSADYDKMFPKRELPETAEVLRFAPSPTGRLHMGNLFAAFIPEVFARQSGGVFILRIEDTDSKRALENGTVLILNDLQEYNYKIDEDPIKGGAYGPYIQSERKEIYLAFAKHLVASGRAYPCFCQEEQLEDMRKRQEMKKERIGYYGQYAKCRNLSLDEIKNKLANQEKFVIRLKSLGNFEKKFIFKDRIKGSLELNQNDIDHVLIKSDGIPPYGFAHIVDDYSMGVTTITRDDWYISSVPFHLEIWDALGLKAPKFAHILPICVKDEGIVRKLSKRKDPQAAISYYHEKGIPKTAIMLYFATILNSNFEDWYREYPRSDYHEFNFSFAKMSKSSPLFDLGKLNNIARNYLSSLSAIAVYQQLLIWAEEFDVELYQLITKYKDETIATLNIEREQAKPRKDYACYSEIKDSISYMYDELFYQEKNNDLTKKPFYLKETLEDYLENIYDEADDKETWIKKIKEFCPKYSFCPDMKEYREHAENYVGSLADFCELLRIGATRRTITPDLYEILRILGKEKLKKRFDELCLRNNK